MSSASAVAVHLLLTGHAEESWQHIQKEQCWTSQLAAAAPGAGYAVWADGLRARATRLEGAGHTHYAVCHLLAAGDVWQAVQVYMRRGLHREALALARARLAPSDPAFGRLLDQLAECHTGQLGQQGQESQQQQPPSLGEGQGIAEEPQGETTTASGTPCGHAVHEPQEQEPRVQERRQQQPPYQRLEDAADGPVPSTSGDDQPGEAGGAATSADGRAGGSASHDILCTEPSPAAEVATEAAALPGPSDSSPPPCTSPAVPPAAASGASASSARRTDAGSSRPAAAPAPVPVRRVPAESLALHCLMTGRPAAAARALHASGSASALATAARLCAQAAAATAGAKPHAAAAAADEQEYNELEELGRGCTSEAFTALLRDLPTSLARAAGQGGVTAAAGTAAAASAAVATCDSVAAAAAAWGGGSAAGVHCGASLAARCLRLMDSFPRHRVATAAVPLQPGGTGTPAIAAQGATLSSPVADTGNGAVGGAAGGAVGSPSVGDDGDGLGGGGDGAGAGCSDDDDEMALLAVRAVYLGRGGGGAGGNGPSGGRRKVTASRRAQPPPPPQCDTAVDLDGEQPRPAAAAAAPHAAEGPVAGSVSLTGAAAAAAETTGPGPANLRGVAMDLELGPRELAIMAASCWRDACAACRVAAEDPDVSPAAQATLRAAAAAVASHRAGAPAVTAAVVTAAEAGLRGPGDGEPATSGERHGDEPQGGGRRGGKTGGRTGKMSEALAAASVADAVGALAEAVCELAAAATAAAPPAPERAAATDASSVNRLGETAIDTADSVMCRGELLAAAEVAAAALSRCIDLLPSRAPQPHRDQAPQARGPHGASAATAFGCKQPQQPQQQQQRRTRDTARQEAAQGPGKPATLRACGEPGPGLSPADPSPSLHVLHLLRQQEEEAKQERQERRQPQNEEETEEAAGAVGVAKGASCAAGDAGKAGDGGGGDNGGAPGSEALGSCGKGSEGGQGRRRYSLAQLLAVRRRVLRQGVSAGTFAAMADIPPDLRAS